MPRGRLSSNTNGALSTAGHHNGYSASPLETCMARLVSGERRAVCDLSAPSPAEQQFLQVVTWVCRLGGSYVKAQLASV